MAKKLKRLFALLLAVSMTMSLLSITAFATEDDPNDPEYTVQYYANLPVLVTEKEVGSDIALKVIDTTADSKNISTSNGVQLTNTSNLPTKNIYINASTGEIRTTKKLTKLYKDQTFNYYDAPNINYVNQIDSNYKLSKVQVKNGDSWDEYSVDAVFTNDTNKAGQSNTIVITEGTVLRLVYDVTDDTDYKADATFFDYDITNGYETNGGYTSANTWMKGINSASAAGSGSRLAFGNANTNNGYDAVTWNGNTLNAYNYGSFDGCTFGLVGTELDDNGLPDFASVGVAAPDLFSDNEVEGKTVYSDKSSVKFNRVGDSYTFTTATVDGKSQNDLDLFKKLTGTSDSGSSYTIWSNNFWPMDNAPTWGAEGHDPVFGDRSLEKYRTFYDDDNLAPNDNTFPTSDDEEDHNSYFGMKYEVEFTLTKDYVGPLDYTFFGDDDMWVFLDGTLICDIGGVHSSVGEYVDLWDYIEKGTAGEHTLTFFYTERGASGSTCYMRFTLPSVNSPKKAEQASLRLDKDVIDESRLHTGGEYEFTIKLTDGGKALIDNYSCVHYDEDGDKLDSKLVQNGTVSVNLKDGEYVLIEHLPLNTVYTITETNGEVECADTTHKYTTTIAVDGIVKKDSDKTVEGTLSKAQEYTVSYENKYEHFTEVPVTKVWNDNNDVNNERPESIQVQLLADGEEYGKPVTLKAEETVAAAEEPDASGEEQKGTESEEPVPYIDNDWTYTWTNLPKYKAGKEIAYTVKELTVDGYESKTSGTQAEGYTITNTPLAKLTITKVVNGPADPGKTFPDNYFKFDVMKGSDVVTTVSLPKNNGEIWSVTLDKLASGTYTVVETGTNDYNKDFMADGYTWTGVSYQYGEDAEATDLVLEAGDEESITATNNYTYTPDNESIEVVKKWDDDSNRDGARPDGVIFGLFIGDENVGEPEEMILYADKNTESGYFSYNPRLGRPTVKELGYVAKTEEGEEKIYEEIPGYTADTSKASKTNDNAKLTITNRYDPETVEINVEKVWDESALGREQDVVVILKADGKEINRATIEKPEEPEETETPAEGETADEASGSTEVTPAEGTEPSEGTETAPAEDVWKVTFTTDKNDKPLYKYRDGGEKIVYTVEEVRINSNWSVDYDSTVTDNGDDAEFDWTEDWTITNSYSSSSSSKTSRTVVKVWNDDNDAAGERPSSITVQLKANGKDYGDPVTLSEENDWTYKWEKLSSNKEWTLDEIDVPDGYTSEVKKTGTKFTVTNTYEVEEIPDPEVPQSPADPGDPGGSGNPGDSGDSLDDLDEPDVPLATVPKTGDMSALWMAMSALSGTGLAVMSFLGRKKRGDEE